MANEYTLHKTVSNLRKLSEIVTPEFNEELLVGVARGRITTWAVYVEHDMANCEWRIGKVEPDRKSTRLNSSHMSESRMPSSA